MAASIEKRFGVKSELVRLNNGIFRVFAGEEKLFDKHETGRFPDEAEVLEQLESRKTG